MDESRQLAEIPEGIAGEIRVLRRRIVKGEEKLSEIKAVWSEDEPWFGRWLALLRRYEELVRTWGEPEDEEERDG